MSDGVATTASCPFVQHADNIARFGEPIAGGAELRDGTGAVFGRATHTCDAWMLATDLAGTTILVERTHGAVVSHGSVHAGQPLSAVASPVALPVRVQ